MVQKWAFFHHVGPGVWTKLLGLDSKHLYSLGHIACLIISSLFWCATESHYVYPAGLELLCRPGWPQFHIDLPAFASQDLGLKARLSLLLWPYFMRWSLSLNLELTGLVRMAEQWTTELLILCCHASVLSAFASARNLNLDPQGCRRHLTAWASSPAPVLYLLIFT